MSIVMHLYWTHPLCPSNTEAFTDRHLHSHSHRSTEYPMALRVTEVVVAAVEATATRLAPTSNGRWVHLTTVHKLSIFRCNARKLTCEST